NTGSGHTVKATYNGDDTAANYRASTSGTTTVTVGKANTSTVITASDNSPVVGETVTYTATVSVSAPGSGSVTNGSVTFKINGGAGVTKTVGAGGIATDVVTWTTHGNS